MQKYKVVNKQRYEDVIIKFFETEQEATDFIIDNKKKYRNLVIEKTEAYLNLFNGGNKSYEFKFEIEKEFIAKNKEAAIKKAEEYWDKELENPVGYIKYEETTEG